MSDQNPDREKLAEMIRLHMDGGESDPDLDVLESDYCCADAILASGWLAEHDELVRREAAAEQREKDARIADAVASNWTMTYKQFAATEIAAAIREQGNDA